MSTLHLLSRHGDIKVDWDYKAAEAGDLDAQAAIAEAERILEEARGQGGTAFLGREGQPAQVIDRFDRTAEKIVVVPRIVGG